MKRIFVLALALILAVSSLAVPSYAAEYPAQQVNLMDTYAYTLFRNNVEYTLENPATPSFWLNKVTSAAWEWEHDSAVYFERIVFTVEVQSAPSAVYFKKNDGNYAACELVHVEGNVYQYVYDHIILVSNTLGIKAEWASSYSGRFNLISCVGYSDNYFSVDTASYFANAIYADVHYDSWNQPDPNDFTRYNAGVGNDVSIPFSCSWSDAVSPANVVLYQGEVFTKIPFTDTFAFVDKVRLTLFTSGQIVNIGARLENSSGNVFAGLESTLIASGETQMVYGESNRMYCYVLEVDTTGYDLRDFVLSVSCAIDKVYIPQGVQEGFYFQCDSISVYPPENIENPFVYFSLWLGGQFNHFNTWIQNQTTSINSVLSSGFQSLLDVFNSSGDNEAFQDQVDQQGDKLDQMDDVLNSVTKPALDRVDTNISGIVSDTDLANTAHVYTYIIDDNIMVPALTMVTILAMMSFALFGKR